MIATGTVWSTSPPTQAVRTRRWRGYVGQGSPAWYCCSADHRSADAASRCARRRARRLNEQRLTTSDSPPAAGAPRAREVTAERTPASAPRSAAAAGRLIGYVRVSRPDQDPALQERALLEAGCVAIHSDRLSGKLTERPGLTAALADLRPGDTLVLWKLDRLGRSLRDIVNRVYELQQRGIGLRCVTQPIDTNDAMGRAVLHVFALLAEVEHDLNRERTRAGLDAARAKGAMLGGLSALSPEQVTLGRRLLEEGLSARQVAALFRVSPDTIYRRVGKPPKTTREE